MSDTCRFEEDVVRAASRDAWTPELRTHAASCAHCEAAASVAPWINRFSTIADREHLLPDPSVLWLKAQLLRASAAADRVARPMNQVQIFAYGFVAAGWAALLTWKWDALQTWVATLSPTGLIEGMNSGSASLSTSVLATALVLGSLTVVLAVHTMLAEE